MNVETWLNRRLAEPMGLSRSIVRVSETWSSDSSNHRIAIRSAVGESLQASTEHHAENLIRLQNLREIPRLVGHALSISHCPDLGGFVLAPQFDGSIGFDVEIAARITVPIAARVLPHASESFLRDQLALADASPIATSIWTAKEAAIKCFGNAFADRTLNYTNVELIKLEPDFESGFSFTARFETHLATGLLATLEHRIFALGKKVRQ